MKSKGEHTKNLIVIALFTSIIIYATLLAISTTTTIYTNWQASPKQPNASFHPQANIEYKREGRNLIIHNISFSKIKPTGSMIPTLGEGNRLLWTSTINTKDLTKGDIILFNTNSTRNNTNLLAVHRIITVGEDEQGWYCITQGDNNRKDDGKTRFEDIKGEVVGIIFTKGGDTQ